MTFTPTEDALHGFVPPQLVRLVAAEGATTGTIEAEGELVVLAADLTGFSVSTNEITEHERAGPERVVEFLNDTFGPIVGTIDHHGGEVLGFAGDAVLATWDVATHGRTEALILAAHCATAAHRLEAPAPMPGRTPPKLRVGIAIGTCHLVAFGGSRPPHQFVAGGTPFPEMAIAVSSAAPGETVLAPTAVAAVGDQVRGRMRDDGHLVVGEVAAHGHPGPPPVVELDEDLSDILRGYVSPPVLARLESGMGEWLAEFRRITSVFINLPSLDMSTTAGRDTLEDVVATTEEAIETYEGTLTRVLADDKGVTLVAAFGLPPLAHEEDPYLAVQAAKDILDGLQQLKLDHGIGITTGRAFCGAYGGRTRREYSMIGREVNLAARFMQAARFEILCDAATAHAARRIEFVELEPRSIKGWSEPVVAFRPLWERPIAQMDQFGSREPRTLIGRDEERAELLAHVDRLTGEGRSAVVMVEGDAGIGKTTLLADLVQTAAERSVKCLTGSAIPVAQAPYHALKEMLEQALGLAGIASVPRREQLVRDRLGGRPGFDGREALLNPVLGLRFPESESSRQMSGPNRLAATVEILVGLIEEEADGEPLLIAVDDTQWLDSASWQVVLAATVRINPLLVVLASRPRSEPSEDLERLEEGATVEHVVLQPMRAGPSLELARRHLDASELAPEVERLILDGAEGIPFFVEELAHSLEEAGVLTTEGGRIVLGRNRETIDVPHTLSAVVVSRIDRLAPRLQLTVKVASVIGRSFDVETLTAVHPDHPSSELLQRELHRLAGLEMIESSEDGTYDFKHSLVRDAAYELLPFDQRRRIHGSVAAHLEEHLDDEAEAPHALLAHHWDRADDPEHALRWLEATGAHAVRRGANREAIEAHTRSMEIYEADPARFADVTPLRRSQWLLDIGQAHEALGHMEQAEATLLRAMGLVQVPVPRGLGGRLGRLVVVLGTQLAHLVLPGLTRVPTSSDDRVRLAQASRIAGLLGEITFFQNDILGFVLWNVTSMNLGEKSGERLVAGLAYSSVGYLAGTMRLRRLSDRYFRLCRLGADPDIEWRLVDVPEYLDPYEMVPGHLIAVSTSESVLALTFGEWERARAVVDEGLERCRELGDAYSAGIALAVRGFGSYSTGALADAIDDYERLLTSALDRSNREHEGWASSFSLPVLLAAERTSEAQDLAGSAERIIGQVDALTVPVIHGARAQVLVRTGADRAASEAVEAALESIDNSPVFTNLIAFAGLLEAALELWESSDDPASEVELRKLTRQGLGMMRVFALALPFARPKYHVYRGRAARLQGQAGRAQRALEKGLRVAEAEGYRWDAALAHLELARLEPTGERRTAHLDAARSGFEAVGSRYDLRRLQALDA